MRRFTSVLVLGMALAFSSSRAQLRLSFVGYSQANDPTPVGFFDETTQDTLVLSLTGMHGSPNEGNPWYLAFNARAHQLNGYPDLEKTNAFFGSGCTNPCGDCYELIAWFEPGEFFAGHLGATISYNRTHFLTGSRWEGHVPMDFTHLRVVLLGETGAWPGQYCLNTYSIPIVWQSQPVPNSADSWGKIKSLMDRRTANYRLE
jgi:hypothetical protein